MLAQIFLDTLDPATKMIKGKYLASVYFQPAINSTFYHLELNNIVSQLLA